MLAAARQKLASGQPAASAPSSDKAPTKHGRKRVRNFTAQDRAAHRVFEKERREAFRERLNELAAELPEFQDTEPQRLSKHLIVDRSIARHKLLLSTCLTALRDIRSLTQERDELLAEVNRWRGGAGLYPAEPKVLDTNIDELEEIEAESERRQPSTTIQPQPGEIAQVEHVKDRNQGTVVHSTESAAQLPPGLPVNMSSSLDSASLPVETPAIDWGWLSAAQDVSPAFSTSDTNAALLLNGGPTRTTFANLGPEIDENHLLTNLGLDRHMLPLDIMAMPDYLPDIDSSAVLGTAKLGLSTETSASNTLISGSTTMHDRYEDLWS